MRDFFKTWRRKVGTLVLVMALTFMACWLRSTVTNDQWHFHRGNYEYHSFSSSKGQIAWLKLVPNVSSTSQWSQSSQSLEFQNSTDPLVIERMEIDKNLEMSRQKVFRKIVPIVAHRVFVEKFRTEFTTKWAVRCCGLESSETWYDQNLNWPIQVLMWKVPYWSITVPLTVLSAWLLICKPRAPKPPGPT